MCAQKSLPLTKEEVMQLVNLVEANPVLFSKATNASNNQLKEVTWNKVTKTFNSLIRSYPRKPEQLRFKWENLKKAARKRSTKLRMNLKTWGGKSDYIPPDETLERVAAILGTKCDDYTVNFEGDAEEPAMAAETEHVLGNPVVEESEKDVVLEFEEDVISPRLVKPLPTECTPMSSNEYFFSSASSRAKSKCQDEDKAARIARNWAIAEYYASKQKREEEMDALKKKKLELETIILQKKIDNDKDSWAP